MFMILVSDKLQLPPARAISAKIHLLLIYTITTSLLRSACVDFTRPGTPPAPQPILVRCAFAPNAIYGDNPSKKAEIKIKKSDLGFFERHPVWDWRGCQPRSGGWLHEMWAHWWGYGFHWEATWALRGYITWQYKVLRSKRSQNQVSAVLSMRSFSIWDDVWLWQRWDIARRGWQGENCFED